MWLWVEAGVDTHTHKHTHLIYFDLATLLMLAFIKYILKRNHKSLYTGNRNTSVQRYFAGHKMKTFTNYCLSVMKCYAAVSKDKLSQRYFWGTDEIQEVSVTRVYSVSQNSCSFHISVSLSHSASAYTVSIYLDIYRWHICMHLCIWVY